MLSFKLAYKTATFLAFFMPFVLSKLEQCNAEVFKEQLELLGSTENFFNGINSGKFDSDLPMELIKKHWLGVLCRENFEFQMDANFQKLHKNFCEQLKNGKNAAEKNMDNKNDAIMEEIVRSIEHGQLKVDQKNALEQIEKMAFLGAKNKENVATLVGLSIMAIHKFYAIIKAKNLSSLCHHHHQNAITIKNKSKSSKRRSKRMDLESGGGGGNSRRPSNLSALERAERSAERCKCGTAVTFAVLSAGSLAGAIAFNATHPNAKEKTFYSRKYHRNQSVVIFWLVGSAVGLLFSLFFVLVNCPCACGSSD